MNSIQADVRRRAFWRVAMRGYLILGFVALLVLSWGFSGEIYYRFTQNTPLGGLLTFGIVLRVVMEEFSVAAGFDIAHALLLMMLIAATVVSFWKERWLTAVYWVFAADLLMNLISGNWFSVLGDVSFIAAAIVAQKSKESL